MTLFRRPGRGGRRRTRATHPPSGLCNNCGQRRAKLWWGDALALTHGGGQPWCEVCALTKQIPHARERAEVLPELEASYRELTGHAFDDRPEVVERWFVDGLGYVDGPGHREVGGELKPARRIELPVGSDGADPDR